MIQWMIIDCHIQEVLCLNCMVEMPWPTSFYASQGDCHCKPTIHAAAFFGWLSARARLRNHSLKILGRNRPNINEDLLIAGILLSLSEGGETSCAMHAAMQHHHLLYPMWGGRHWKESKPRLKAYISADIHHDRETLARLDLCGWKPLNEGSCFFGNARIWDVLCVFFLFFVFFGRPHDIYEIGSCSNESFTVSGW